MPTVRIEKKAPLQTRLCLDSGQNRIKSGHRTQGLQMNRRQKFPYYFSSGFAPNALVLALKKRLAKGELDFGDGSVIRKRSQELEQVSARLRGSKCQKFATRLAGLGIRAGTAVR